MSQPIRMPRAFCASALMLCCLPLMAADEQGFVEDSTLKLINRNFYFNRDFRSRGDGLFNARQQSYREEWAQGFQAFFSSGYSQGTVGVGVDAHGLLGLKLDSGGGTSGTNLLPLDSRNRAEDDYSAAGGALKLRAFDTELKAGDLFPVTPVYRYGDGRLLPQSFRGVSLRNTAIDNLTLQGGHLHAARNKASSNHDGDLSTEYGGTRYRSASYLGGDYSVADGVSLSLYQARFEDVWNQTYISVDQAIALGDHRSLSVGANLYRTRDEGAARAGKVDTDSWSAYARVLFGGHSLMLAHQRIHGDEPFDYLGDGDSIYLANSVLYSDFNSPNERSWQLRYDFNFAALGVPGLGFMTRYLRGSHIDNAKVDPTGAYAYYAKLGSGGRHWERDFQLQYVIQSGPAKNLSLVAQQTIHRANAAQSDGDVDQVRIIIQYPLDLF
ncbi:OprD family porin [Pseudomonas sp. JQ170]|uniref:OprD family porin n=1 Tax=unclassified Pseudomonas TaxID=196821 RepID=UPI00264E14C8|nr:MULTISPECIES: OprD family porin [unclassified Pseudomonas]MDN7143331.1 OprD family porin [Pseudomonas sp. JQ170]WRO78417.1 OprD family porin [Pseudomonas sp. 170C]